jgi:hypothetical protein
MVIDTCMARIDEVDSAGKAAFQKVVRKAAPDGLRRCTGTEQNNRCWFNDGAKWGAVHGEPLRSCISENVILLRLPCDP